MDIERRQIGIGITQLILALGAIASAIGAVVCATAYDPHGTRAFDGGACGFAILAGLVTLSACVLEVARRRPRP